MTWFHANVRAILALLAGCLLCLFRLDAVLAADAASDLAAAAIAKARPGETILLPPVELSRGVILRADRVTLRGQKGTHFRAGAAEGKAAIVVKGSDATLEGIECSEISVPSGNGACIRLEGRNLTLRNVYFHDSEQGVLTVANPGRVQVVDSRFERLGKAGQAHGIYVGGGELEISGSHFLSSKDEGHEIKSRAALTIIRNSVIASLSGRDSRLVDVANGGRLLLVGNVLQKGPASVNETLVGFGLEGLTHPVNEISIKDNLIILERTGPNRILHSARGSPIPTFNGNKIIGHDMGGLQGDGNAHFRTRREAGLPPFPRLPDARTDGGAR